MRRNKQFYDEKELRQLYEEYERKWTERYQHGEWVKVEPYQRGWSRHFVLRDDITRRADADRITQALAVFNHTQHDSSMTEPFYGWPVGHRRGSRKTRRFVPMVPRRITHDTYCGLDEGIRAYFFHDGESDSRHYYSRTWRSQKMYSFYYPFWLVEHVEPIMVTERWVPDPAWESRMGEISLRIERHNLWPKFSKLKGWRVGGADDYMNGDPYTQHRNGVYLDDELNRYEL